MRHSVHSMVAFADWHSVHSILALLTTPQANSQAACPCTRMLGLLHPGQSPSFMKLQP